MIQETITYSCRKCGSRKIVRNGRNRCGSQQYLCRDCNASGVLRPKTRYSSGEKAEILRSYDKTLNMRKVARQFGVSRKTLANWLRERNGIASNIREMA